MIRIVISWGGLILLLLMELLATLLHADWIAWIVTPLLIMTVASVFMRVTSASQLSKIFALAGVFWIVILLGLGTLDYAFRRETRAPGLSAPYAGSAGGQE